MKVISLILSSLVSLTWMGCQAQAEEQKCWVGAGDLIANDNKPLLLKHTDVKISVTGIVASVQVEQVSPTHTMNASRLSTLLPCPRMHAFLPRNF